MANGLIGMIPGVSKVLGAWGKVRDQATGGGGKSSQPSSASQPMPSNIISSPGFAPNSPSVGVNGTTSPRGKGKWGGV